VLPIRPMILELSLPVTEHRPKKHLVAAIRDVELYRVDDDFGCQWIRMHNGIKTCMSEKAARMFFADAKRTGEIFDLEELE